MSHPSSEQITETKINHLAAELYQTFFEQAADGVFIANTEGDYIAVNPCGCEMSGCTREEILNRSIQDLIPAEDVERDPLRLAALRAGKTLLSERHLRHKDGRLLPVEVSTRMLADGSLLEIARGITEHKQTEQNIALLNFALDNVREAAFLIDENAHFCYVNEESCRVLGYTRDQLLSLRVTDIDPDFPFDRWRAHWDTLKTQPVLVFESRHRARDGRIFPVEVNANYFEYEGREYNLALVRDITTRKQAEQEHVAHLWFLESMDQVNQAIQGTNDLNQMMSDALDAMLTIFACDRASLVFPCDPEAASWHVPTERTRPEYPGALALGIEIPMDPDVARSFRIMRATDGPVKFGLESAHPLPPEVAEQFGIKSFMGMALYPKVGKPWELVLHQCAYPRVWTAQEERLFQEIGQRLADGLTSLLSYRSLRENEEKYRSLIQKVQTAIVLHDGHGRILSSNPLAQHLLGLSEDQLLGKTLIDPEWHFLREDGTVMPTAEYPASLVRASRQPLRDYKVGIHRPDQDEVTWALVNAEPEHDDAGEIAQIIVSFIDITALRQVEDKLRASETRFRTFVDHAADAFFLHTEHATILDVNHQACESLGYSREELIGKTPALFDAGLDRPFIDKLEQQLDAGEMIAFETRHRRKDGSVFPVEVRSRPFWLGERRFSVSLARDMTERKQAEDALRDSERRLAEAQRLAHIGSWELNLTNNDLTWSAEIFRIFEIDPHKFGATYEAFLDAIHPDDREAVNLAYANSLKTKTPYAIDHRLLFPDGRIKYVHEQCETFYDGDNPIRSTGTVQDITERKLAEEALHHLNRELRAISNCNQVLMRAVDEPTLLNDICRIVCDEAGYHMAWVGYAEHDEVKTVRPVAWAGVEDGYLAAVNFTWGNTEHGRGLAGTVIRTGESACIQDFITDPKSASWRENALLRGYRSSIALPLKDENATTFGALCIYSTEPNTFTPDEIQLLEELAGDLAFGVTTLRTRAERKRAEEALREGEERYRLVFENSPVSIWEEDLSGIKALFDDLKKQGVNDIEAHFVQHPETVQQCADLIKIVDVNQAALALHGAANKAELLAGLVNTFTAESFDTFRQELICLWNGEMEMTRDAVVQTLAGGLRNVTVYFSVCPGYEETLSKILVSLVDITERKQAEEALSASEAELRTLIEAMTDVIFVGNSEGRYLKIVDTSPSLLYKPPDQLLGKTLHEVFPKEQADFFLNHIRHALNTQKSVNFEYSIPVGNEELWFNATISPMSDDEILMVARDITDRKQAEKALRDSERRLSEAQRIAHIGYWERNFDIDRIILSDEACRIFGLSPHDFPANLEQWHQQWLALIHPEDQSRTNQAAADALQDGPPYNVEYRIIRPDGEMRFIHSEASVNRDETGRPHYMLGMMQDITARKQAEEEVRRLNQELEQRVLDRTAQLEAANKELEAFAYSVSHDLRAPLRHIDGFLELLRQRTAGAFDERSQHYMATISDAAMRMGQLIDDLLTFSRMGRNELVKTPVDLGALVEEVIEELAPEMKDRIVNWHITPLPTVTGDRAMLRLALVNLLANALKFTRGCASANIEVDCQADEKEVVIFIRDNGVGFDMTYADKLFGVFQRLHPTDEFEGTGIGLANVRRIINRHNGRTWAEGAVNHGATFYFSLPQINVEG